MAQDLFANASLFTPKEPGIAGDARHQRAGDRGADPAADAREQRDGRARDRGGNLPALLQRRRAGARRPAGQPADRDHARRPASVSYIYSITDAGRARALQYFEQTTYVGPAPSRSRPTCRSSPSNRCGNISVARRAPARGLPRAWSSTTAFSTRSARR